jgi:uncharacterized protein YggE
MPDPGTIAVNGTGRASAVPDQAIVHLGVQVTRPTAAAARGEAATTMASVLEALLGAGIERADVRTETVALTAAHEYPPNGPPRRTGYEVTNRLAVIVRRTDVVATVVDAAIAAGATTLDGLELRLSDPAPVEAEALRAAIADAGAKAEAIAGTLGARVGEVRSVEESPPPPVPGPMLAARMEMADTSTPIEAGRSEVVATVRVVFGLA